jgi:energy-coupling factor transport system permease protein
VSYRRRASPLHAARAGVGAVWCAALLTAALSFQHPLVLGGLLAGVLAAARAAGVDREVRRALALGLLLAVPWLLVTPLVDHNGVTVLARTGDLPLLGVQDVTLEATVYGAVLALRALVVVACAALLAAAVDPDELLRGMRRASVRSGVTAALAARLMPVLHRDARRLADAQRARSGAALDGAQRLAVLRAVAGGALDRATDVAATLELRGYGLGHRPPRRPRPWSRHDVAFLASALTLAAAALAGGIAGWDGFAAYPRTVAPVDAAVLALTALPALVALAPFLDRRGVEPC